MKILTISGSTRPESSNIRLLNAIPALFPVHSFERYPHLSHLPIFKAEMDKYPWHAAIVDWRTAVQQADAVIISIPEYIHNMPALIKNALEWLTLKGELAEKRVLAITLTPHPPRGEKAMQSLLWTLQALNARVVAQLPLYQNEIEFDKNGNFVRNEGLEFLQEGIKMLTN